LTVTANNVILSFDRAIGDSVYYVRVYSEGEHWDVNKTLYGSGKTLEIEGRFFERTDMLEMYNSEYSVKMERDRTTMEITITCKDESPEYGIPNYIVYLPEGYDLPNTMWGGTVELTR